MPKELFYLRPTVFLAAALTAFRMLIPGKAGGMRIGATQPHGQFVSVSLPAVHIGAGERVVGFDFEVTSGRIAQITDMPIGWNVSVDNDPSWNAKIHASVLVAAAALDASYFEDFVVIEKEANAENPFELKGKILVSTDFSKVRDIQVGMKDFTVQENVQFLKSHASK
jgi:hypothetical protein